MPEFFSYFANCVALGGIEWHLCGRCWGTAAFELLLKLLLLLLNRCCGDAAVELLPWGQAVRQGGTGRQTRWDRPSDKVGQAVRQGGTGRQTRWDRPSDKVGQAVITQNVKKCVFPIPSQ